MGQCRAIIPRISNKLWCCANAAGHHWFCHQHRNYFYIVLPPILLPILLGIVIPYSDHISFLPSTKIQQTVEDTKKSVEENKKITGDTNSTVNDSYERLKRIEEQNKSIEGQNNEIKNMLSEQNATKKLSEATPLNTELPTQNEKPIPKLQSFIDETGISKKYPLGYLILYSNGRKTLSYGPINSSGYSFDPTDIEVNINGNEVCMSKLPVRFNGNLLHNISYNCFTGSGGINIILNTYEVSLIAEPLAISTDGASWVIGLKKIN